MELASHLRIREIVGEARRLRHGVLVLVVAPMRLGEIEGEIHRGHEEQEREEAAQRRASGTGVHHWDCTPRTISSISFSMACRLPETLALSAYSPSATSA